MHEDSEELLKLDRQVCFALAVASRSIIAFYRPILEPLGLTHPQYLVMLALWDRSPMRFGELAETLQLDPATLSPIVRRLEAMGLITRTAAPTDARVVELAPTAAGRALRQKALAVPGAVLERLGIPLERLEALRDELNELIAATRGTPRSA